MFFEKKYSQHFYVCVTDIIVKIAKIKLLQKFGSSQYFDLIASLKGIIKVLAL